LQALNLLNSGFIMQQANYFAARLEKEAGMDVGAEVQRAFGLTFQRQAESTEATAAARLIQEHGLPVFCRALLNASEFIYVF
jgi:hypothetical protein